MFRNHSKKGKYVVFCMALMLGAFLLVGCGDDGSDGKDGKDGQDGLPGQQGHQAAILLTFPP